LLLAGTSLAATSAPAPTPSAADAARADRAVGDALARGADPVSQARELVGLAWPAGPRDEAVAARARRELADFGVHSMVALREAINTAKPAYAPEIVRTTMAGAANIHDGGAPDYVPVYLDALWINSHDARAMAIDVLIPVRSALSVQPMIDAALEDPSLAPQVVAALGALRFDQARFYLEKVMMEGPPSLRPVAAASLTQIGGAALAPLKNALKAPDRDTRLLAARALLPAATERELGALYDFIRDHGNDDPALTQALRGLTVRIEQAIAARDAANAAGAPKDF
jgi:HEAT repeat protein